MTILQVFQCNMMRLTEFVLQLLYGWERGLEFHIDVNVRLLCLLRVV